MAIRSTATVAAVVKRRGTGALGVNDFIWLQENSREVKKITALLKKHGDLAFDAERAAKAAEAVASSRLAEVAKAEDALTGRAEKFQEVVIKAEAKQRADMDALDRRTREVTAKEDASEARATALDARERTIESMGRTRENELRGREEAVGARETDADERDQAQQELAADLKKRTATIETAAKMLKQAAASLR